MYVEISLDCSAFQSIPEHLWPDAWHVVARVTLGSDDSIFDISLPAVYEVRDGKASVLPLALSTLNVKEQNDLVDALWDQAKLQLANGFDNPGDEYDPDGGLR